ncbi:hypothetical protein LCGC14_1702430 [marine sediment metagenome]|uniref:Uncharacterized protein n=1 Tax=marine sediment metagenome TaxID=412755 RepID=A0A0F9JY09_9ZZZZ
MHWKDFKHEEWKQENEAFDHVAWQKSFDAAWEKVDENKNLEYLAEVDKAGNQIEVYFSDEGYYCRWIAPGVELHLSFETDEVIGGRCRV